MDLEAATRRGVYTGRLVPSGVAISVQQAIQPEAQERIPLRGILSPRGLCAETLDTLQGGTDVIPRYTTRGRV